jgi:transposase
MRMGQMSKPAREGIEKAYKTAKHPTEKVRYQALKLLTQGYARHEVAAIIGMSLSVIGTWITAYHKKGLEGLREKRTTGNHRKLTREQKDQITQILKEKTPEQCGEEGKFWTVELLKKVVITEYGITYRSPQSYRALLTHAGFSFHKPGKVHKDQNPYMRKRFEQRLKKNSKSTGEKMVWYW